jgi:hypothetical protein
MPSTHLRFAPRDARGAVEGGPERPGHSTMEMTMRYAHLSPDLRRDSVRLLDGHGTYAAHEPREQQN